MAPREMPARGTRPRGADVRLANPGPSYYIRFLRGIRYFPHETTGMRATNRIFRSAAIILTSAIPLLSACSGDSTGSSADLSGRWNVSISKAAMPSREVICDITGMVVNFSQSGNSLSGSTSGGLMLCSVAGMPYSESLNPRPVASGTVNGSSVTFTIAGNGGNATSDKGNMEFATTQRSSGSLSGTLHWLQPNGSGGVTPFDGTFTATR